MNLRAALTLVCLLLTATLGIAQDVQVESYTLPNGLAVTLHEDHRLPQVTINTWFGVGSKDEPAGRTGFAHLFEHLMFMGTERVPGNSFDLIMEGGGGANNASTSVDRTNYYSWGPSSLLPTLLWLDADRLDGLGRAMTQEKLDLQRSVVRNERRQNYENAPYGAAGLIIPAAMYPEGHPYHHPTIGSHEDLEAASLQDVKDFFATYYVPGNASLVIAGDFDPAVARKLVAETFGAVEGKNVPAPQSAEPVVLEHEVKRLAVDQVEDARLYLVWHSPAIFAPGDAAMDLISSLLSEGSSSRLYRRLVLEERLAKDVTSFQYSKELGSEFRIQVTATGDANLEHIKHIVLEELERLKADGPTEEELARVKASIEASFLRHMESLRARADAMNRYRRYFGYADAFEEDLEQRRAPGRAEVQRWAEKVFGQGRLDLRILPAGETVPGASLDERPADLEARSFTPPLPESFTLTNGVPVHLVARPGSGLFSAAVVVDGGERLLEPRQAGLASLCSTMLTAGAGGRDAAAFADAVTSLGAEIRGITRWNSFQLRVNGLSSRLDETLDLFSDALLRPNLLEEDFQRERELALAAVRSRAENPGLVARVAASALLFGRDDPRGWPTNGYEDSLSGFTLADVKAFYPELVDARSAQIVVVGDVSRERLAAELESRLAGWTPGPATPRALPAPLSQPAPQRIVLVDRPDAKQSVIYLIRPLDPPDEKARATRALLDTILGGTFTSRLNQNIREEHGYSYGARSMVMQSGNQYTLRAFSSVQTEVTAAALGEFKYEFERLAAGDVSAEELAKAAKSIRYDLMSSSETTGALSSTLSELVSDQRPLDAVATQLREISSVDLDHLNEAASSGLFDWNHLLVVVVGDRATVLPQLEAAGFAEPLAATVEGEIIKGTD